MLIGCKQVISVDLLLVTQQDLVASYSCGYLSKMSCIRPKKKLFVSCNPTLQVFKIFPYLKVFSALPTLTNVKHALNIHI